MPSKRKRLTIASQEGAQGSSSPIPDTTRPKQRRIRQLGIPEDPSYGDFSLGKLPTLDANAEWARTQDSSLRAEPSSILGRTDLRLDQFHADHDYRLEQEVDVNDYTLTGDASDRTSRTTMQAGRDTWKRPLRAQRPPLNVLNLENRSTPVGPREILLHDLRK
ncbi:hypothetical protein N7539_008826 [Penicillium diatomitis]|uniref:Uncharacterized protein n=1 Tax=Penicillium diatomitis TaxID=2819901 RepID=A0A9W9WQP6_9EURO|nr:uncharacterized protein N7539_008826 [Penicillium diatomitis]KAJ5471883.1 hypothetical protein N7539_008826 [Penicillium diatomitis]